MSQKFKSDIEVQAGLRDSSGSLGTSGQVLSTTGTGVAWINENQAAHTISNQVKAGVAINKGQAVYVTGADGTNIIVGLASNTSEATSSKTLGLLDATVATNGFANVIENGRLPGLNTLGANAGDPVWLGVNGNLIYGLANKPYAPAHLVFIGIVTRVNANNGEIFVNVQNGFELKEIHDVDIVTNVPINGDVLGYDGTLWVNKTIAEWLGYTPANASGTTNYVSKFTGSTTLGNSQIFDNGTNVGIGTSSPTFKLQVIDGTLFVGESSGAGSNQMGRLSFGSTGIGGGYTNYGGQIASYSGSGIDVSDLRFYTGNGSVSTERMRITSSGNVGIGTSSPSSSNLLEVNGRAFTNQLQYTRAIDITSANLNDYTTAGFYNGNGLVNAPDNGWWWITVERYTADANWVHQTATSFGAGNTPNQIYTRTNSGGTWTNWRRLIDWTDVNGTTNYVSKFTSNNSIGNSQIFDNGTFVGFGTTSPNSILDVREANRIFDQFGNINIFTSNAFAANIGGSIALGGASNTSGGTSPYPFAKLQGIKEGTGNWAGALILGTTQSNSAITEKMRITSSGNVGIGTSSPSEKLDIVGNARIQQSSLGGTIFFGYTSSNYLGYYNGDSYYKAVGNHYFESEFSYKGVWNSAGNLGIGTTSPSAKLHVVGFGVFDDGTNGRLTFENASGQNDIYSTTTAFGAYKDLRYTANNHIFRYASLEVMRITSGNVGIGTSSPNRRLTVSDSQAYIGLNNTGGANTTIGSDGIGSFIVYDDTAGSYRMVVNSAGNVGIGTTSPSEKLEVNGVIKASGGNSNEWNSAPKIIYLNVNDGTSITGTTALSIGQSVLIPANTFSGNGLLEILFRGGQTTIVGGCQFRFYKNTTNSLTGATLVGTVSTLNTSQAFAQAIRTFRILSNNMSYVPSSQNVPNDYTITGTAQQSTTFDVTVDNYIIISIQNGNVADATRINMIRATKFV